jgi:hypothetical protein
MSVDLDAPFLIAAFPLALETLPREMLRIVPYHPIPFIARVQGCPGAGAAVTFIDLLQFLVVPHDGKAIDEYDKIAALIILCTACCTLGLLLNPGRAAWATSIRAPR